jgi:hypothetical protein
LLAPASGQKPAITRQTRIPISEMRHREPTALPTQALSPQPQVAAGSVSRSVGAGARNEGSETVAAAPAKHELDIAETAD